MSRHGQRRRRLVDGAGGQRVLLAIGAVVIANGPRLVPRAPALVVVFSVMVAADVFFILLNVWSLDATGRRHINERLFVGGEWTLPEVIQYAKWATMALALRRLYGRFREPLYGVWAAAFAVMAIDDALALHERIGRAIAATLSTAIPPGVFELVPLGLAAAVVLAALWREDRRPGTGPDARRFSRMTLGLGLLYAAFAVGVDAVEIVYRQAGAGDLLETQIRLLENGGELITATLMFIYTVAYFHRQTSRALLETPANG